MRGALAAAAEKANCLVGDGDSVAGSGARSANCFYFIIHYRFRGASLPVELHCSPTRLARRKSSAAHNLSQFITFLLFDENSDFIFRLLSRIRFARTIIIRRRGQNRLWK